MLNASSSTVSFHTSSPKSRAIISGVTNDGATTSTKISANTTSSQRTIGLCQMNRAPSTRSSR